jgi:hypothetical protein
MDQDDFVISQMMVMLALNSNDLFTSHEMEEEDCNL